MAIVGNIEMLKIAISITFFPLNRNLAKAYAADAPIKMLKNVVHVATTKLLNKYFPKGCFSNTLK